MENHTPIKKRRLRNPELFDALHAYFLYNTGRTLSPNTISTEINKLFTFGNFKPSDDTISRYIKRMQEEGELICLDREYAKTNSFNESTEQPKQLKKGRLYYLNPDAVYLTTVSQGFYYATLKAEKRSGHSLSASEKKIRVCYDLCRKYDLVCGGVIVYHYNDDYGKDNKITIDADFLVKTKDEKRIFMFSSLNKGLLPWKNRTKPEHVRDALLSLERFAKIPVTIVLLWETDPLDEDYLETRNLLIERGFSFIRWNEI